MLSFARTFFPTPCPLHRLAFALTVFIPLALIIGRAVADICVILVAVIFLCHCVRNREWAWLNDWVIKCALVAWVWLIFITPFAVFPEKSLGTALAWIRFIVFFAALRHWLLAAPGALKTLSTTLALLCFLVIVDTLFQYATGTSLSGNEISREQRLSGPFSNLKVGIYLAKICLPVCLIAFYIQHVRQWKIGQYASLCLMILCITTIFLSGERTAFLTSLTALIGITLLLCIANASIRRPAMLLVTLLVAGLYCLYAFDHALQDRIYHTLYTLSDYMQSIYGQIILAGYYIGNDHWLTGAGFKSFRVLCPVLVEFGRVNYCAIHPHHIYIEWYVIGGVFGLASAIAIIGSLTCQAGRLMLSCRNMDRLIPACMFAMLLIHFFPFMPTQSFFSNWPAILMWYSLGMTFSAHHLLKSD